VKIREGHEDRPHYKEPEPSQPGIVAIDASRKPEGKQTTRNANDDEVCHLYLADCHVTGMSSMRQRTELLGRTLAQAAVPGVRT
jgi:hypothetical protein